MDLVRQAFALETMDHAQALLGLGNSLLGSSVEAPPLALGEIETLDHVLRDVVGLQRLQDVRAKMLDNVKTQLGQFGRIVR